MRRFCAIIWHFFNPYYCVARGGECDTAKILKQTPDEVVVECSCGKQIRSKKIN